MEALAHYTANALVGQRLTCDAADAGHSVFQFKYQGEFGQFRGGLAARLERTVPGRAVNQRSAADGKPLGPISCLPLVASPPEFPACSYRTSGVWSALVVSVRRSYRTQKGRSAFSCIPDEWPRFN